MNARLETDSPFSMIFCLLWLGLLGWTVASSGCASLPTLGSKSVPTSNKNSVGQYRVEMSGGFGGASVYDGTLDGPHTVQTALEQSGAIKKYRNMNVTIWRVVEETGQPLKMATRYEPRKKAITPDQDYALMPGDRIVVEMTSNSLIDKMVDSASGK